MKTLSTPRLAAFALVLALAPGAGAASAQQRVPADPASAAGAAKVVARIPSADSLRSLRLPPHPRLFADAARFAEIRAQIRTDPTARALYERVKGKADRYLADPSLPEHVIPDGLRLLATSRRVLDHVSALSLVGAVERDPRYAAGAWRELRAAAAFPDWNPKHFLDVGEMTTAFCIGYDWLYDQWTEDQRETLRRAIVEKGLTAALQAYHGEPGPPGAIHWIDMEHNWNQVTNGGIGIGALAVMDVAPGPAGEALHDGLVRLPLAMRHYGPDGAWFEGPGYWHYATLYNALILSALDTALGTDYGLSEIPGFDLTGGFPAYLTGPFGPPFAFADVDREVGPTVGAELFWLAHRFHQPAFAAHQLRFGGPGGRDEGRSSAFNVIWYTPDLEGATAGPAPLDRHFRLAEVVAMRSSWTDPAALYVGFKGGDNKANHTDLDLGTFVLDALGVRWATELGSDDYNMPGYFDSKSRRWTYYRTRAEGQNTLVIEPDSLPDQDPEAESRMVEFGSKPDGGYAVADLSAAYARHARRVERGIALLAGRSQVLVQDEIRTARPSRVWWFMHTEAAAEVGADGSTAVLTQDGKRLWAKVLAPAGARFQVMDAHPLPTSPNPKEQDPNRGVRKLAVRLDGVTGETRLAVLLVPLKDGESAPRTLPPLRPLSQWEAGR
jgi:hypothetical protein